MAITTYAEKPAGPGHNAPPATDAEALAERLKEDHRQIFTRKDELVAAAARVPEVIETEDAQQRVQDFVKQIAACIKAGNAAHDAAKEPFLAGGRTVDTVFYGQVRDPLTDIKKRIEARCTQYLRRKEEAERQRRMEAERRAREEAEAARRRAEEAAAEAHRQRAEAERIAREERARAEEAERARRAEEEARIASERDLQEAVRRQEEETRRRAEEDRRRQEAEAAAERQREADQQASERAAQQAAADAERAAKDAEAKAAELSRTRGEHGSVASLRTFWDWRDLDRDALNLEMLRQHIPEDALAKAVRSWIKANADSNRDLEAGRQPLRGVVIFKNTAAQVR